MRHVTPEVRAAALAFIQQVEQAHNIRVIHAVLSPTSGDSQEAAFSRSSSATTHHLKIGFLKTPEVYLGQLSDSPLTLGGTLPGQPGINLMALDVRDSYRAFNGSNIQLPALAPYLDALNGESLVRSEWMEGMAPRLSGLGRGESPNFTGELDRVIQIGVRYSTGQIPAAPSTSQQPSSNQFAVGFQGFGGGAAAPQVNPHQASRARSVYGNAYTALCLKAVLSRGPAPQPDQLEWPPELLAQQIPPLRQLISNPAAQDRALLQEAIRLTNEFVQTPQQVQAFSHLFGAPSAAPAASESRTRSAELQAAMNELTQIIQTAQPATQRAAVDLLQDGYLYGAEVRALDDVQAPRHVGGFAALAAAPPAAQQTVTSSAPVEALN